MKINFVLPAAPRITGGPLAILEYAERLRQRGHDVSITTGPPFTWESGAPFPWFQFSGKIHYDNWQSDSGNVSAAKRVRAVVKKVLRSGRTYLRNLRSSVLRRPAYRTPQDLFREKVCGMANTVVARAGIVGIMDFYAALSKRSEDAVPLHTFYREATMAQFLMNAMPDCDVNIATHWSTAIPVYFSNKGKPTIFMQHYEEVFYPVDRRCITGHLLTRLACALPIYKIANSSWLAKQFERRFGQKIPFANNALVVDDFCPRRKKSEDDGILRIVTYSRREEWKGFPDAVAAMRLILEKFGKKVQWHVFGYLNPSFPPDNEYACYEYHPDLAFSELARLYAESDVTLCPAWYESFPLPPLESMASGTAVVTTAYGTEDYAFHEQNALVVKSRDAAGMAEAVARLLENPELRQRLAQAGRAKAEEYSWDRAVDVREQMLQDICSGNVAYDLFATTRTGIADEDGIPFEKCPGDLDEAVGRKLIRIHRQHVYLFENGCKRHITRPKIMNHRNLRDLEMVDVDALTGSRIPTGCPIITTGDL
jgi:glycosyltransferase involved in cell wall biosynthesis